MQKILVLADDLTGAAEIGGVAFLFGLSVRILLEHNIDTIHTEEVIIIDTNTRCLSPDQAFRKIYEVAASCNLKAYDLVYKKVDSILRGPIESEIRALMAAVKLDSAVLVPANPSRNRIIRNGKYYVGDLPIDQTEFRHDPEFPRLSENVDELVMDNSGLILTGSDVEHDIRRKILVPDIASEDDMRFFVTRIHGKDVLAAGASDFFRSILIFKMKLNCQKETIPFQKAIFNHFIIGSQSESSKHTLTLLTQKKYSEFRLPLSAIDNDSDFNEWLVRIMNDLDDNRQIVVSGPVERVEDQSGIKEILCKLVRVAKLMVERSPKGSQFFIEGGETASLFYRTLRWTDLQIHHAWKEGVVLLANIDSDIRIAIKPGSYSWPKEILNDN